MKLLRSLSIILLISVFVFIGCQKDEDSEGTFMGIAYIGQSIPIGTRYSYSEGIYSTWVSFIDQNSYNWGQEDGQGEMSWIVPCEYNSTTGEFSDSMVITHDDNTYGRYQYFPASFCIDNMNKMYLFTFNAERDTSLIFPRPIFEKTIGSEGTLEGSYTSGFTYHGWFSNTDGFAENRVNAEVNYTYGASTFSGTYTTRIIGESTLNIPEYEIEIGTIDSTYTVTFSGTWEYNKTDNTISEIITSPIVSNFTYTPYWVSYNDKLYLVTSLTRFYQKE